MNQINRNINSMPYRLENAFYKVAINDVERPERNHPIHDSCVAFDYGKRRYSMVVVFDGVSESKTKDSSQVNISKDLQWDLEDYCRRLCPKEINDIARWFISSVAEKKYEGLGATTISVLRFDVTSGAIDGFTLGDSPALLVRRVIEDSEEYIEAQVLSPLNCVINYPGVITQQWKYNAPVKIAPFTAILPNEFEEVFLVCLSDGFGKLSDRDTIKFIDDDLQDRTVSQYFPHFSRVYLPDVVKDKFPDIKINSEGTAKYLEIESHKELGSFLEEIYPTMDEETKREMCMVDLDAALLYDLYLDHQKTAQELAGSESNLFNSCHQSLRWMVNGVYNDSKDESGLDEYLREYIKVELFTVSMIEELLYGEGMPGQSLQRSLRSFFMNLDPIGDDFSVALLSITKSDSKENKPTIPFSTTPIS
jgi:hypothetical protein